MQTLLPFKYFRNILLSVHTSRLARYFRHAFFTLVDAMLLAFLLLYAAETRPLWFNLLQPVIVAMMFAASWGFVGLALDLKDYIEDETDEDPPA